MLAQANLTRTQSLASTGDVPKQSLDQATSDYAQAQARLDQARAAYANAVGADRPRRTLRLARERDGRVRQLSERRQRSAPGGYRASARRARSRASIGPVRSHAARRDGRRLAGAGRRRELNLHPGDLLGPNQQAAIIDTFADPYAYIYASQHDLAALTGGKHVRVVIGRGRRDVRRNGRGVRPNRAIHAAKRGDCRPARRSRLRREMRIHDPQHQLLSGTTVTVYPQ